MTPSMKQKLDAQRDRLSTVQTASIRGPHEQDLFCMGWDQAVETVLRVLRDAGDGVDLKALEDFYTEIDPDKWDAMGRVSSMIEGANWQYAQIQPVIAALKLENETLKDQVAVLSYRSPSALMTENEALKSELEITKQKSEVRGQSLLKVSEENERFRKALEDLANMIGFSEVMRLHAREALRGKPE